MKRTSSLRNILFLAGLIAIGTLWYFQRPAEKGIPFIDEEEVEQSVQQVEKKLQDLPQSLFSKRLRSNDSLHLLICGINNYAEAIFDRYATFLQNPQTVPIPLEAGWQACAEQIMALDSTTTSRRYGQALLNLGALLDESPHTSEKIRLQQALYPIILKAFEKYIQADSSFREIIVGFLIEKNVGINGEDSPTPSFTTIQTAQRICTRTALHTQQALNTWLAIPSWDKTAIDDTIMSPYFSADSDIQHLDKEFLAYQLEVRQNHRGLRLDNNEVKEGKSGFQIQGDIFEQFPSSKKIKSKEEFFLFRLDLFG
ncbi:MAG: hypothetical protein AAFR59_07185 [Bacteroidota bacterium]